MPSIRPEDRPLFIGPPPKLDLPPGRSQVWLNALLGCVPWPVGEHTAIEAVTAWCAGSPARLEHVLQAPDDMHGGYIVGRALKGGGWSHAGLAELVECLTATPERLREVVSESHKS